MIAKIRQGTQQDASIGYVRFRHFKVYKTIYKNSCY